MQMLAGLESGVSGALRSSREAPCGGRSARRGGGGLDCEDVGLDLPTKELDFEVLNLDSTAVRLPGSSNPTR
ncbi:unnamed protein product [Urochloa humidicola]